MEITWYGRTCTRLRGKEGVVANDAYPSIVGPTGRGITADVITYSHPDDSPPPRKAEKLSRDGGTVIPTSLHSAFVLDGPGEYEVHDILVTGVRTFRDDDMGVSRGRQTAFVVELDGIHVIHLGDIGHQLSEEKLGEIGRIAVACVPVGGALTATSAAALVAQLDPRLVIPMPVCEVEADCEEAVRRFLHEMGAEQVVQPRLSLTASSLPTETTTILLESRGKV